MARRPEFDQFWRAPARRNWAHKAMPLYRKSAGRLVNMLFQLDLVEKTNNFDNVEWLGYPVWQNVLDLWTTQEAIASLRPGLIIETGSNRGGSAIFYAHLCELMGHGEVVSVDISSMHDHTHPRASFLIGNSTDTEIVEDIRRRVEAAEGQVMVILDSNHDAPHVAAELAAYSPFVTPGSLLLVQDGVIDTLPTARAYRPGPLPAIREFLARHPEFEVDEELNARFLITHHPMGWLRRRADHPATSAASLETQPSAADRGQAPPAQKARWATERSSRLIKR